MRRHILPISCVSMLGVASQVVAETDANALAMTDSRNSKSYKVVKYGAQIWMAENLNFATGNSWCYDDQSSNCDNWGRLYDWKTARKACPSGWHLPSDEEWRSLARDDVQGDTTSGTALKSIEMKGTNTTGFNALPGGGRYTDGTFGNAGRLASFWTSSVYGASAYFRTLSTDMNVLYRNGFSKATGFSVRCVKDGL